MSTENCLTKAKRICLTMIVAMGLQLAAFSVHAIVHIDENVSLSDFTYCLENKFVASKTITGQNNLVIETTGDISFYAPKVILGEGFHAKAGSNFRAGTPTFDVHFVVLLDDTTGNMGYPDDTVPNTWHKITPEHCRNEVAILNENFRGTGGEQLVRFKYKSLTEYSDAMDTSGSCWDFAECVVEKNPYNVYLCRPDYDSCSGSYMRDSHAINFYIIDRYKSTYSYAYEPWRTDSWNKPAVFIDYERLRHGDYPGVSNTLPAEEHEMGHAFGLSHVCDASIGAGDDSDTMQSELFCSDCNWTGGNGLRNKGFSYVAYETATKIPFYPFYLCFSGICQQGMDFNGDGDWNNDNSGDFAHVEVILWYAQEFIETF